MTDTADDDAFCAAYGDHLVDCTAPLFSERDLAQLLFPETMLKLNNWIHEGYITPQHLKDPRGGRDRRRYSIAEIARITVVDGLVNGIGIPPRQAIEVANFAMPFLNDCCFDRHPDGARKSAAVLYVISWLDRKAGRMKSSMLYRKPDETAWYEEDPYLNLDAAPCAPPAGVAILLPITEYFSQIFMNCAKFLVNNKRDGITDKYKRPIAG
jgi:hypothetical protein